MTEEEFRGSENSSTARSVERYFELMRSASKYLKSETNIRISAFKELAKTEIEEEKLGQFLMSFEDSVFIEFPNLVNLIVTIPLMPEVLEPNVEKDLSDSEVEKMRKIIGGRRVAHDLLDQIGDETDPIIQRIQISQQRAVCLMHEYFTDKGESKSADLIEYEFRLFLSTLLIKYGTEIPEGLTHYTSVVSNIDPTLSSLLYDVPFQDSDLETRSVYREELEKNTDRGVDLKLAKRLASISATEFKSRDLANKAALREDLKKELENLLKEYPNPSLFIFRLYGMNDHGEFPEGIAPASPDKGTDSDNVVNLKEK